MSRIVVLVSNDLVHDQRVRKVCSTLDEMGFEIELLGRMLPNSSSIHRPYAVKRFRLPFTKGALFYASLNIRLFFYLLFKPLDIILANDLDTLLPAFLVAKLRGKHLVYDSHEYFTEAAGLADNPFAKKLWLLIEGLLFPRLSRVITVNESIAGIYREKYKVEVKVVRNIPPYRTQVPLRSRSSLGLPEDKHIVLLQGAFIDPDRGAWEAAQAMRHLDNVLFLLIGAGEEWERVKDLSEQLEFSGKIRVLPKLSFDELREYTAASDLGLSLDKDIYLNYKLSLPNKIFDYIQARVPVLISPLPELKRILDQYPIGLMIEHHNPLHIASKIREALNHEDRTIWKENLEKAAQEFTWENEAQVIREMYQPLLKKD